MHQCASQCRGCVCVGFLVLVCVLALPAFARCGLSRSRPPRALASTVRFRGTEGGKGGHMAHRKASPTHLRLVMLLPLNPSHSAVMPSVVKVPRMPNGVEQTPQSMLSSRLQQMAVQTFRV